VRDADP